MSKHYIEEKKFDKTDFIVEPLIKGEYAHCTFTACDLSNADLSGITFSECEFKGCNISMAKMKNTSLKDVRFIDCKLLGLNFEHCNEFLLSVYFENCNLNLSNFHKLALKKTTFKNCSFHEADFSDANLTASTFDNCDLARTIFANTILEKADLRTAYNYSIDPEVNKIKKAKFSMSGIAGLLHGYDIEIE